MKTRKIILQDYCDKNVQDLIVFEEEVDIDVVGRIVDNLRKKLMGDYMFDDVLEEIKNNFKVKEIYDLYSTTIIQY